MAPKSTRFASSDMIWGLQYTLLASCTSHWHAFVRTRYGGSCRFAHASYSNPAQAVDGPSNSS